MKVNVKLFLIVAALCGSLSAMAQPPIPFMWVPRVNDTTERNKFMQGGYPNVNSPSKASIFNSAINGTHPVSYNFPVSAIHTLIRKIQADDSASNPVAPGIRMYFAAFDSKKVPTDFQLGSGISDKQVIMIWSGSNGNLEADVPKYYVISPFDMLPHQITDTSILNDWCNNYNSNEDNANGLPSTLEAGNPDNQVKGTAFDTRSIYYEMDHFKQFLDTERCYQDTCQTCNPTGVKIDSIGIFFADYLNTGVGCNSFNEGTSDFKDRLFVLFEFMRGGQIYFIEDAQGFSNRSPSTKCQVPSAPAGNRPKTQLDQLRRPMGGGDNGQLCPPNCPCPPNC